MANACIFGSFSVSAALMPSQFRSTAARLPGPRDRTSGAGALVRAGMACPVAALTAAGLVRLQVGTVREILPEGSRLRVGVRSRTPASGWLTADPVVSCTGPLLDYARVSDKQVMSLRPARALTPAPLHL